jgi:hypothetical protein
MLARRECVEDPTKKEVHGVPCAAHRKLGFVGLAMVGKTVQAIVQYFTMPPHSTWNPCGTDLFHVESMDSTWIPHGICFTT